MRIFLVDDSMAVRAMLRNIIEEERLGTIEGEAEDGSEVYLDELLDKKIDVLLIDLLMPNRSGLETIEEITPHFNGKIIMISQVENKEMIAKAYTLGVDSYITKPINRIEVVSILNKTIALLSLERSFNQIQKSISSISPIVNYSHHEDNQHKLLTSGKEILFELGIIGEAGNKDLLDIIHILQNQKEKDVHDSLTMRELYEKVIYLRLGHQISSEEVRKEIKACEQRIRRLIHQALEHIASLGLTDYTNPKFEHYSSSYFDHSLVRLKMTELEKKIPTRSIHSQINIKKFINAFFMEVMQKSGIH